MFVFSLGNGFAYAVIALRASKIVSEQFYFLRYIDVSAVR